ncbi:hypothetical protein OA005_01980 [Paracoccaceae bacterium]|nr:hypothetical protein [Paracoccaceae bacterium]
MAAKTMVETESFIKEVSEEVKKERLFKFIKKYRWVIGLTLVIIIGSVAGLEYYKFNRKIIAEKNGEFLYKMVAGLKEGNLGDQIELSSDFTSILFKLSEAKFFEQNGEIQKARETYKYIISNFGDEKFFNHYSKYQLYLMRPARDLEDKDSVKFLDELSAPDAPLKLLAMEQKLYIFMKINDKKKIKSQIDLILSEPSITPEQLDRIREVEEIYEINQN